MLMRPIHASSGNLLADRRYEWARDAQDKGDLAAAADLLTQALELTPGYAVAWFALGEVHDRLGEKAAAIAAFRSAREADPDDRHGAALHLTRLGAAPVAAMPEHYVRTLFDGYAPRFDRALTEGLGYRGPELLLRAVEASDRRMKFGSVADLGCGTGLGGAAFRAYADRMVGVDLSSAMLAEARGKGIYDRLVEDDVVRFLAAEGPPNARYHLILAADVFVYLDDLAPVLEGSAQALAADGIIAFSVETHEGDGVILRDTLRYAHGAAHVRAALADANLKVISLDSAATRTEKGAHVPGLIVVAGH
jgi:predicted TPR repeat methyltransferase